MAAGGFSRLDDGRLALTFSEYENILQGQSSIFTVLGDLGSLTEIPTWDTVGLIVVNRFAYSDPLSDGYTITTFPISFADEPYGVISTTVDSNFNLTGIKHFRYPPGLAFPWSAGSARLRDGNDRLIIILDVQQSASFTDLATIFAMVDSQGDSLTSRTYTGPFGTRDMCETEDGYAVLFDAAMNLGPDGRSKVLYFDDQFNYTGGFALNGVAGAPPVADLDGDLYFQDLHRLPNGDLIIATTHNSTVTGILRAWPFLFKYTSEGVLLDTLRGLPLDLDGGHRNFSSALTPLADGNLLWHFVEAVVPGYQSQDHFIKVDEDLAVLGEIVLEGVLDEYYYYINGVVEDDDGGILVCGQAGLGATQLQYTSYVAKLAGLPNQILDRTSGPFEPAYPNPGSTFSLLTLEPCMGCAVEVNDARGSLMHRSSIHGLETRVYAQSWASGLYHYRVMNNGGQLVQAGKWVRE